MKRAQPLFHLALGAILIFTVEVSRAANVVQERFAIEEYELFHDVLEPLEHEALPQGDFRRIRSMSTELVTRGKAILKLGVPEAPRASRREFTTARREFDKALIKFRIDVRSDNNNRVKDSFTAVHDSFEKLADLVPAVYPVGMPPIVDLDCRSSNPDAGNKIILTANTPLPERLTFLWTVDKGKILSGQGTPTITIDTVGLTGQTISVNVEVNDSKFGLTAAARCQIQISAVKQLE